MTEYEIENKKNFELLNASVRDLEIALKKVNSMEKVIKNLEHNLIEANKKNEIIERQLRQNSLEIIGFPYNENENTQEITINIINKSLNLNITDSEIDYCYRKFKTDNNNKNKNLSNIESSPSNLNNETINKNDNDLNNENSNGSMDDKKSTPDYHPIIVIKFVRRCVKDLILKTKYDLKPVIKSNILCESGIDNSDVFINESLTFNQRKLLSAALKIKREKNFRFLWVRNGVVRMRKNINDKKAIVLKDLCDLDKLKNIM